MIARGGGGIGRVANLIPMRMERHRCVRTSRILVAPAYVEHVGAKPI
jgi:hypothetical protein